MHPSRLLAWYIVALSILVICDLVLVVALPNALQSWAALVMAVLLPGLLSANWLLDDQTAMELGERVVLGVGAGFGLLIVLMLALSYLPGGLSFAQVTVTFNLLVLFLLMGNILARKPFFITFPHRALFDNPMAWTSIGLAVLLLSAAFLRFTNIAYSEFHGDEAWVAMRANDVIQGWERALFFHKKGPGEILTGTTLYVLTGELTEFGARLPFALASWTGVWATYLLGKRWFGTVAAWWAGAMVLVDGYLMAFARMLQYQSIVFLMTVLALLAIERARQQRKAIHRYFLLAALLLATAMLSHYEGVMVIVPAGVLLIAFWQQQGGNLAALTRLMRWLAWPLTLCAMICIAFYVPFVRDPEFWRNTVDYLFTHRLVGDAAPEVFATVVARSTLYSSSYYFWTLVVLTLVGMIWGYHRYTSPRLQIPLILLLATAMLALLLDATTVLGAFQWPARITFVLLFAPLWFGREVPAPERALWLWFGLPLMAVIFIIAIPGTHVYIFFIPWALLTAKVLAEIGASLAARWGMRTAHALLAPILVLLPLLFGNYTYQLFVRNDPEILYTWDENRPPGYWTSFNTPIFLSIFGFPLRNGWKSAASLFAQGKLVGRFESSERYDWVPDWYLRGVGDCGRDEPNYYLTVVYPLPWDRPLMEKIYRELDSRYYLWGVITTNEQPHMRIYAHRDRVADEQAASPRTFREEDYAEYYNEHLLTPFTPNGPIGAQPVPNPARWTFGDVISLVGHNVHGNAITPGGEVEVQLYWRAEAPITTDYFVSIQAINLTTTGKAGQRDGEPGCNRYPTSTWVAGDTLFDRYIVPIEDDAVPGDYQLLVKMYDEQGTLPVTHEDGTVSDGAILSTVTVR